MDQPTATLVASIVTAGGSTLVGLGAIVLAWRHNLSTLLQQRQMASDERLGDRRIELYVQIIEVVAAKDPDPDARSEALEGLRAHVIAFASNEVQGFFDGLLDAEAARKSGVDVRSGFDRLEVKAAGLISVIRSELRPRGDLAGVPQQRRKRGL
jgi:hypothetical protein